MQLREQKFWIVILLNGLHTAEKVSDKCFCSKTVQGDSMTNPYSRYSLPEGILIIVDPEVVPINRSIVVVRKR